MTVPKTCGSCRNGQSINCFYIECKADPPHKRKTEDGYMLARFRNERDAKRCKDYKAVSRGHGKAR